MKGIGGLIVLLWVGAFLFPSAGITVAQESEAVSTAEDTQGDPTDSTRPVEDAGPATDERGGAWIPPITRAPDRPRAHPTP